MPHRSLFFLRDDRAGAHARSTPRDEQRPIHATREQHPDKSFHDQADGAGGHVDGDDTE